MNTLISELRSTIIRRVQIADSSEVLALTSALCANEAANDARKAITPAPIARTGDRFERRGAGTLLDHQTGLAWTRGNVVAERLNWHDAKAACEKLDLDGGGWRLPTIRELLSIVNYDRKDPAIDEAFTCESSWYWTSTPYAPDSGCAWLVHFGNGNSPTASSTVTALSARCAAVSSRRIGIARCP